MSNKKYQYDSKQEHISQDTIDWIKLMNGAINNARMHPNHNLEGYNPEFWLRLKANTIKTIPINGQQSSHLLSWGEVDGKIIIYPLIHADNNGKLFYNPDMNYAIATNNYVVAPSAEIADNFTKTYKEADAFKGFRKFNPISNITYWNDVLDNFPKIKLLYTKLQDSGYSPGQIGAIIGNLIVESHLNEYQKEKNGSGYGLAQWTDKSRKEKLNNHPSMQHLSEFERLLDFLLEEMQNPSVWHNAKKNKTIFEQSKIPYKNYSTNSATTAFMSGYENPNTNTSHEKDRQEVANYIVSLDFQNRLKSDLLDYSIPYLMTKKLGGTINYFNIFK